VTLLDRLAERLGLTRAQALTLFAIVLGGLVVRLAMLALRYPHAMSHDELGYDFMARQLVDRGVLGYYSPKANAYVTPGYPLALAGAFKLAQVFGGGHALGLAVARVAQALLGAATIALVFALGRKVANATVGLGAAAIFAVYPSSFMAQGRILTESLFTALFVGWLLVALVLRERRSLAWHIATGALFALAALVRPTLLPLLPLLYVLDVIERRDWRFAAVGGLVAVLAFSAVMSPWWIRNRVSLHRTVLFATESGNPFLRGTDPWDPYDKRGPSVIDGVPEADQMRAGVARVREGLRTEPLNWIAWFTVGKWWYLWGKPWMESWLPSRVLHDVAILVLGWIGVVVGLTDRRTRLLALSILVITGTQLLFIPIPRYAYPLTPVAAVLGMLVVVKAYSSAGLRRAK